MIGNVRIGETVMVSPGWKSVHARHAHQARLAVDLSAAGSALAGFAVPAYRHIVGLLRLDRMNDVEHYLSFADGNAVVFEFPAAGVTAPHPHMNLLLSHYFFSSSSAFSSSGISGSGS